MTKNISLVTADRPQNVQVILGYDWFNEVTCGGLFDIDVYDKVGIYYTREESIAKPLRTLNDLNDTFYARPLVDEYTVVWIASA